VRSIHEFILISQIRWSLWANGRDRVKQITALPIRWATFQCVPHCATLVGKTAHVIPDVNSVSV